MTRPSAKKLATKVDETMAELSEKLPEEPIRWKISETTVDIELPNAAGFGGHTIIGGVSIGGVLQGIELHAGVNQLNRLILHTIGMPTRLRAIAEVEIIEHQILSVEEADDRIERQTNAPAAE